MKQLHIEEGQIQLWQLDQADFDLSSLQADCLSWLTDGELQRYHRYQFDRHRKQLLLGRALLRVALSSYDSSITPSAWKFSQNDYGKPAISETQNSKSIYFNLSHSSQRIALVVARFPDIGVDIELSSKERRVEAIAERFFSPLEVTALLSLPKERQLDRFYDLWTLKEAYIKACGMGLAIPLQHFSYGFPTEAAIHIEFDERREDSAAAWQFWQLDAQPNYKLAIAAKAGPAKKVERVSAWRLEALDRYFEEEPAIQRIK